MGSSDRINEILLSVDDLSISLPKALGMLVITFDEGPFH